MEGGRACSERLWRDPRAPLSLASLREDPLPHRPFDLDDPTRELGHRLSDLRDRAPWDSTEFPISVTALVRQVTQFSSLIPAPVVSVTGLVFGLS